MPFSFTFKLAVPGISNPFQPSAFPPPSFPTNTDPFAHAILPPSISSASIRGRHENKSPLSHWDQAHNLRESRSRNRLTSPSSTTLTPPLLSKKRGWAPSAPEPSQSMTTVASTSGYLDTPAKYRAMAEAEREAELNGELPPTKRRRTLAGSIVSTALSAALIGTAVGLTVYRLWRDRGKEPEQLSPSSPPPPYREGEWRPAEPIQSERPYRQNIHIVPPTPQKRRTQARHTASIRKPVQRRARARPNVVVASRDESPFEHLDPKPTYQQPAVRPEFDFGKPPEDEVEDQMDWIGDKLSMLIEEGKRALGREVVVMSDAREDEVDDGAGGWEEEVEPTSHRSSHSISASRHSSMRRSAKRPRAIATSIFPPAAAHTYSSPASPSRSYRNQSPVGSHAGFSHSSDGALTPRRGSTVDREFRVGSVREDEENWESPELKEQMERARARIKRNRI